ncbi:subtilisin-like protease SBT1.5 [Tasmannia lanceolata]|uniref:subtilisin-like protease SBT1.5 n=1 Tax=Tasmannia lanceolata TaxID=3420 RepID=UPI004063FB48
MGLFWVLTFLSFLTFSTSITDKKTYIIRVQNDLKPSVYEDIEHWYSSTLQSLTSEPFALEDRRSDLLHIYTTVFHGFSARLSLEEAEEIKKRTGILAVFPDKIRQIQTTRSPEFIGLMTTGGQALLEKADFGSNIVIGILDTGIWPERESFSDKDLSPIPPHWKGECVEGPNFTKANCNTKIVGARIFPVGYEATSGAINDTTEFKSARDNEGHGTHTASTAAGRNVGSASLFGFASGNAVGIAPKARIAIYKVCWENGCMNSDILSAFDKATEDGVDIISISVGGDSAPYSVDPIAIGAFGAMERGILISASGGNEGPGSSMVTNIAPWITTVGAGTIDRNFPVDIILGNGMVIPGVGIHTGDPWPEKQLFSLVDGGNFSAGTQFTAAMCMRGSLDPNIVRGKIVLCDRGMIQRVYKGGVVKEAGGAGMILANVSPEGDGMVADAHVLPAALIGQQAGYDVHNYIRNTKDPKATFVFHGTQLNVRPAPVVASFSSRGPNYVSPHIMKPDLIAPGVNILAAWPDGISPTGMDSDPRRTQFNIMSGTSMACPHVSGVAALLKGAHPDWSPAGIRSAMMTTADILDKDGRTMLDETMGRTASVWAFGSGYLNPDKAIDPGLIYDLTAEDYLNFLCDSNYTRRDIRLIAKKAVNCTGKRGNPWELNYPSISLVFDQSTAGKPRDVVVSRTVTNVGDGPGKYTVKVSNPDGVSVAVEPRTLEFGGKGEKLKYIVRISAERAELEPGSTSKSSFGDLLWEDGRHVVRIPVAVTWTQPN